MNEHNAVADAIYSLQNKWRETWNNEQSAESSKSYYSFIRWIIEKQEFELFKGFLKLESSSHGSLEENFIILLTPFEGRFNFSYQLASDWLTMFEQAQTKLTELPIWEDFKSLKAEHSFLSPQEDLEKKNREFLIKLFRSFKAYEGKESTLIIGLLPSGIAHKKSYIKELEKLIAGLPKDIVLMGIDFKEEQIYEDLAEQENGLTLNAVGILNSEQIYEKLATERNSQEPEAVFNHCLFQMGKAMKQKNKEEVYLWGEKAIETAKLSSNLLSYASAHLIYSAFLFRFSETKKIESLLESGIKICNSLMADKTLRKQTSGLLAQFYSYKAAYLNIKRKHRESLENFKKQAEILAQNQQVSQALSAFQNAIIVAKKHAKEQIQSLAEQAFNLGYALNDQELQTTAFSIIAYYFLEYSNLATNDFVKEIEDRMDYLYAPGWKQSAKKNLAISYEK